MSPVIPPASAILVWALPTSFDEIRCLVWEEDQSGWRIAVVFGEDTIGTELVPNLKALWAAADVLWRGLAACRFVRK